MTDTIPDWAIRVFCERAGLDYAGVFALGGEEGVRLRTVVRAGARLVMQHEQPPADPDEEAVKRILEAADIDVGDMLSWNLARAVSQYKQEKANG